MSSSAPALPRRVPRSARGDALRSRARALIRGRVGDPRWVRPALLGVLALAAALCLWDLTISGYANTYYAAAAKAGSESWKALFFGALDPGSFITVDKPPLSLWMMGLSARVFGYSSFSILLPQALCMIAAVGLLYGVVRRQFGPAAGVLAAAALAVTPVAVAMARVDMPDALLVLLLVLSARLLQRALETGRTRHLAWCGAIVGLAFMTKMLEGWMVVPALAGTYLLAGPPRLGTRLRQLAVAGGAMVVVSAAWPVAVTLWPGSKPYIGGSTNGSIWNLIFGYNGFGRLTGDSGPGGQGANFGGASGIGRMFNAEVGGQIAWLLPLAAAGLLAGLWLSRSAPRTDRKRAGWLLFGGWALVDIAVFSSQQGIFHPYYVSALAPAVAALAAAGIVTLARWARRSWVGLAALDVALVATAAVAVDLLGRTPSFAPWLRVAIPVAVGLAVLVSFVLRAGRATRPLLAAGAVAAALAVAGGPVAYSVATVGQPLQSSNVLAGPSQVGAGGFGGAGGGGGQAPGGAARTGARPAGAPSLAAVGARTGGGAGAGGLGGGGSVSTTVINYLEAHQGSAKYLVAAIGSHVTAPIIIATGKAVVTIGGFNGNDPTPTVSQLASMVAKGELRYVLLSSGGMGGQSSSALQTWVKKHGTAVSGLTTTGGTLYRVTA
jgi:4-amino-4-deoxy-L-arabinose transferase-like glycosyltransferase